MWYLRGLRVQTPQNYDEKISVSLLHTSIQWSFDVYQFSHTFDS